MIDASCGSSLVATCAKFVRGKLQTQGIAAALKILLTAENERIELAKTEIIALMNSECSMGTDVEG